MNKLEELLQEELDELRSELSSLKGIQEAAQMRIKSDQDVVLNSGKGIAKINTSIEKVVAKIGAIQEDAKAIKVAAEGFLKGLRDDETTLSDESKLNFQGLCEALGIEIEIDADENAETDEEAEEGSQVLQTGT